MSRFDTMDYTICAAILCYGTYLIVQNVRLFPVNEKMRKEYLNKHKDGYTMVSRCLPYIIFFLGFSVTGITGTFAMEKDTKDELYACFALALMVIISAGMALDSIVKRRAIVDDDGFIYEKAHYHFRSILSTGPMESVIKNIDILTTERQRVVISRKMGIYLHECFLAWRRHKKSKNKQKNLEEEAMVKLAVFDVDGTLIAKGNRRVPASCIRALNELSKEGVRLTIASGRPPFAMEQSLLEQVGFDYPVCSNGAFVRNAQHEVLYHYSFIIEEIRSLIHAFKKTDNVLTFQCQGAAYCYYGCKRIADMLQNFLGQLNILVDERESEGYLQGTMLLAAVVRIGDIDPGMVKQRFPQSSFTPFDICFYDVNGAHDKVTGVSHVCEAIGWDMQDMISFGDDYNDLEMIKTCGVGAAMGDAREAMKEAVDYVSGLCSRNGITQALLHYRLIDKVYDGEAIFGRSG